MGSTPVYDASQDAKRVSSGLRASRKFSAAARRSSVYLDRPQISAPTHLHPKAVDATAPPRASVNVASSASAPAVMGLLPKLPAKAAYILLKNKAHQNVLSLNILRNLQRQLEDHLRSPTTGQLLTLPPFRPDYLPLLQDKFEDYPDYRWLTDTAAWDREFAGRPSVLVLRSEGPVFCAGYDLKELTTLTQFEVKEMALRLKDVLTLMRQSPIPIVCPVQGLAEGPGFQLATTADFPIALADTPFRMSGIRMGLPSVGGAVMTSRRLPPALAYRLFATGDVTTAKQLGSGVLDVVNVPEHAEAVDTAARDFEARVESVIGKLAKEVPAQSQAFGKWAFWSQLAIRPQDDEGDGYDAALDFAANVLAMNARSGDGIEGINAWKERREPVWERPQEDGETISEAQRVSEEQPDSEMQTDEEVEIKHQETQDPETQTDVETDIRSEGTAKY